MPATSVVSPNRAVLPERVEMSTVEPMNRAEQALQRIRDEMSRKKLSQRDVAGILDWSQGRVAKILTGRVELRLLDLESLCFAVGLQLTEAVRDPGLEFVADMTPSELRLLERFRQLTAPEKDAYSTLMRVQSPATRPQERRALARKPIIPPGRDRSRDTSL